MQNNINTENECKTENEILSEVQEVAPKKSKFAIFRAAFVCLLVFTVLCGIIYPISATIIGQTVFPYEANGSQIEVTLADGTKKIYGSELIGQNYESAEYLFGRVNAGAPSNLSPESEEFEKLLQERIDARKEKLAAVGYADTEAIPDELLTASGSGVDPHISPDAAYFQVGAILAGRKNANWKLLKKADETLVPVQLKEGETVENYPLAEGESLIDYTQEYVRDTIKKYTEGRFLGVFGEKRVNVLLVNLSLDGLI